MTKRIWTGVFAVTVAFTTTATIAQTTSSQSNTSSADRQITVTGCLKEAPSSSAEATATGAVGTTGAAGGAAAAATTGADAAATQKFVLTDAARAPADTSGSAASTGTTATAAASGSAAQTYKLIANPAALSPHVGKKLELTGTLEDQNGATQPTASSAGADANASAMRVTSGKIVAESCSQ